MHTFGVRSFSVVLLILLAACSHGPKEHAAVEKPAKLQGESQMLTGKVVLVVAGYRFRPADSEDVLRLTRAKQRYALANEEIGLRKYYGKTLAVRGKRDGEWIWAAEVVGQWLAPGETRGPNLTGPEVH